MSEYTRPQIAPMEFRDASGQIIDYGNRWASTDYTPPDDSYSVEENLERFQPLHTVANALIEYLVATYDVAITEGPQVVAGLLHAPDPEAIHRAVRLTPRKAGCAELVIIATTYQSVKLYAGVLFDNVFPSCACNACDETWESGADELEEQILAIVAGRLTEKVSEPKLPKVSFKPGMGLVMGMGQTVSYSLHDADGADSQSGSSRAADVPRGKLKQARATLATLKAQHPQGNWQPWPKLTSARATSPNVRHTI